MGFIQSEDRMKGLLQGMVFFLSILVSICAAENERCVIAINDMAAQGVDDTSTLIISDRIRNEFVKDGHYTVVERTQMETILKEQSFQQSGACNDQTCIVEMGQLLGVEKMVAGSLGKLGGTYTLSLRMIDIKTGEIAATSIVDCKCEIDEVLSAVAPAGVRDLLSNTVQHSNSGSLHITVDKKIKGNSRKMWRIAFGTGAFLALVSGVLMNQLARTEIDEAVSIKQQYLESQDNTRYDAFSRYYRSATDAASRNCLVRNISYTISGLCVTGLVLTFTF